ncbi:MAG TPA: hypothetical protein VN961_06410, partial [Streptosporangiaceae bacterium]|nr:hypothetical protein [Streptosporangiaceae bacterium]
ADDDARRQIDECRRYIADFEAARERSSAPAERIDRMMSAYPDLANPYTLWVAAYDLLGDRNWRSEQISGGPAGAPSSGSARRRSRTGMFWTRHGSSMRRPYDR